MILTNVIEAVEKQLATKFNGAEVEIVNYTDTNILFNVLLNDKWVEGNIQVKADSDLGVHLRIGSSYWYQYQFDILWCDILPE